MRRGFTFIELAVVLVILALVTAITFPRLQGLFDWIAVNNAAQDVTTAVAVTRNAAIMQGSRRRLVIAPDSLRIDGWTGDSWARLERWPGPDGHRVTLEVSNPVVVFDPIGLAWGVSNTKVVLRRGVRSETITLSRLGRVKRW
jgi:prepilin-type N-terminal cleavage/methylation domain-containing protein